MRFRNHNERKIHKPSEKQSFQLKTSSKKCWDIPPEQDSNFVAAMEDILDVKGDLRTRDWLHSLARYAMSVTKIGTEIGRELIVKAFSKILSEKEVDDMTRTMAEELILEGEARGKVRGKTEAVLTVLQTRFNRVPKDVEKAIRQMTDPVALDSWTAQAASCQSMREFAEAVK